MKNVIAKSVLEIEHNYGPQVVLLNNTYALTLLDQLSSKHCEKQNLTAYMRELYRILLSEALNLSIPKVSSQTETRMSELHPNNSTLDHSIFNNDTKLVTVNIARAGSVPSQLCYDQMNLLFNPDNIRQDHFFVNRKVNENNEVIGVDYSGSKIGGPTKDRIILIPDPMGATGSTIDHTINFYESLNQGDAKQFIALHLIITPEAILKLRQQHPKLLIVALRLDRGLSSADVLKTPLGTDIEKEKGLNQRHYIVPGAGGIGELMNNAEV